VLLVACLILPAATLRADTAISPRELGHAVRQTAQAPEYDWSRPTASRVAQEPAMIRIVRRISEACSGIIDATGDAIRRFVRWLLQRPSSHESSAPPPRGVLPLGVYLLIGLTIVAGGLVAWRLRYAREPAVAASPHAAAARAEGADLRDLNPLAFPEQEWFELADRYLRDEQWRMAVRALYLASLAWLGRRQFISIHSGKTNRQYERELGRRVGEIPGAQQLFAANIRVFERAWYGMHELEAADATRFRGCVAQMISALEGMS
jgi:hypothetical protein